jgi:uncharacterized secreted protein with C-terminal beta-propeller domain
MTDNKFILMGLDDERAGNIAEVLKNPTCKKILNFLGDIKEASEKDISDSLKTPINTVEYNLKKLIKSGLVKKTKNFFWSVKGKKIPMYKLAKKHIIISPNKKPSMNYLKNILPVILIAILVIALTGLFLFPEQGTISEQDKIKQFQSQEDLTNFIKQNSDTTGYSNIFRGFGSPDIAIDESTAPSAVAGKSADSSAEVTASDYSTTNIQVKGVDEADIVKNDGKHIYAVTGNKVKIIDAYPAENMNILSEINISGVNNIFINKDKLIVFANTYNAIPYELGDEEAISSIRCVDCGYGESLSLVYIYDISDKKNPILENDFSLEGNYVNSRMINNYVYIISTKYANVDNPRPPIYYVNGIENKIAASDVAYWPYQDTNYIFTSITAVNIENGELNNKVYLTGSTNNIFFSQDNIYLTYHKTVNYKEYTKKIAEEVYYPILSQEYNNKIKQVLDSDKSHWQKLSEMQEIVNEYSKSLKGDDFSDFSEELSNKMEKFNIEIQKQIEKTIVHKINVNEDNIKYKGVGEVPGRVLNQFSMDEYKTNLRIATTTGNWRETSLNHVYVLDKDLKIVGSVEDLAQGERIFSARFIENRAYMVTFKQVDPLFVIDLSNPQNPEVLGYLKITGVSDYLHPYDEDHIIGIGREATEEGRLKGMKIALFDVSDVKNPIEKAKIEIGDRGTSSSALYDHKAFLFDKEKGLLVIPISVYESKQMSSEIVFNGAYVLNINDKEISLRDKITHFNSKSKYGPAEQDPINTERKIYGQIYIKIAEDSWEIKDNDYNQYSKTVWTNEYIDQLPGGINYNNLHDYQYQIQRSLYMDDVLYTISQSKIKANDLDSIDEINSLDLGYEENYYPYPIYEIMVTEER